ncbi:BsuBI/PstI family type II restriction endonuclease [Bifidobacterium sp. ESL0682]|uniref:BsuBI/PstI family type II restriction endonuclease n=1 Tax=Bifidobacterium sp. ESL0682 TaxID=2983212 RepID=UPI0023F9CEE9|nr:BsuBI/PstI family type II restriction endonuclease [Bifidobacterium sp. ESL0682]WEV42656.1 BsuBI/PstI family type II restriction endonuclease [Bifidobacterium sp. ESL0682]
MRQSCADILFFQLKTKLQYLPALAWETEAWCADTPDHLMHFDGSRFMGPYNK